MTASLLEQIELILLISAVVAIVARRLRMPYIIGLVIAGIGLSLSPVPMTIPFSKELIFNTLLPPLIFEAALYIPWKELRRDLPVIGTFATIGVLLSAAVTAIGMHYLAHWEWPPAMIFGALIAATDPVSVIATFKEAGVHGRLRLLVEAESLLNDGTAAVLFVLAIAASSGGESISGLSVLWMFMTTAIGGIICGLAVAWLLIKAAGKTEDHLVEITFTMCAAYGSFLLAEHFHMSGVLASMAAGLMLGNPGALGAISEKGRDAVATFWEYAAFLSNSMIFILIGMHETKQAMASVMIPAAIAIALVLAGRALAIYPCSLLFLKSKRLKVEMKHQHILFWGGMRGALALALAMGLPDGFPRRNEIIVVSFILVAFSLFVQGLTMTPLLKGLKLIASTPNIGKGQRKKK